MAGLAAAQISGGSEFHSVVVFAVNLWINRIWCHIVFTV